MLTIYNKIREQVYFSALIVIVIPSISFLQSLAIISIYSRNNVKNFM